MSLHPMTPRNKAKPRKPRGCGSVENLKCQPAPTVTGSRSSSTWGGDSRSYCPIGTFHIQHALDHLCPELLGHGVRMRACLGLQCSVTSISSLFPGGPLWVPLQKKPWSLSSFLQAVWESSCFLSNLLLAGEFCQNAPWGPRCVV